MFNPYQFGNYNNVLPQQQVIQVNGKASVDTIQLAPNSSVLVMDTSAPLVWLCVSDGVGRVNSTAYKIEPYIEKDEKTDSIENRLQSIETSIAEIEKRMNNKEQKKSEGKSN